MSSDLVSQPEPTPTASPASVSHAPPARAAYFDERDSPRLGKVLDFMRVVWAVDHGLQSCSKEMEARLGITGPQRLVIRIVGRSPGIAAGELAETLKLHPSTLTGILRRLEQRQILVRSPDPRDARRALFRLTEEGRRLDQVRTGTVESAVRRAMRRLRPEEVSAARAVLMTLAEEMSADSE